MGKSKKSVKVSTLIYAISGVIALVGALLLVLLSGMFQNSIVEYARFANYILKSLLGQSAIGYPTDVFANLSYISGMLICLLGLIWMILSLTKKRPAGIAYFLSSIALGFIVSYNLFLFVKIDAYSWNYAGAVLSDSAAHLTETLLLIIFTTFVAITLIAFVVTMIVHLRALFVKEKVVEKVVTPSKKEETAKAIAKKEEIKKEEKVAALKEEAKKEEVKEEVKPEPKKEEKASEPVKEEKKVEPVKEEAKPEPVKEAASAKKEEKKTESVTKAAPNKEEKKAEPVTKAAPKKEEKKVEPAKEEKKAEPAKKAAPAKKAEPAKEEKKVAPKKEAAPVNKEPAKVETPNEEVEGDEETKQRAKVYHVSRHAASGKWQVKLAGGKVAIKLFDTQLEAIKYAKELAANQEGSIRVHSLKGKMRKA